MVSWYAKVARALASGANQLCDGLLLLEMLATAIMGFLFLVSILLFPPVKWGWRGVPASSVLLAIWVMGMLPESRLGRLRLRLWKWVDAKLPSTTSLLAFARRWAVVAVIAAMRVPLPWVSARFSTYPDSEEVALAEGLIRIALFSLPGSAAGWWCLSRGSLETMTPFRWYRADALFLLALLLVWWGGGRLALEFGQP